jgi:hypothetical protein
MLSEGNGENTYRFGRPCIVKAPITLNLLPMHGMETVVLLPLQMYKQKQMVQAFWPER